MDFSILVEKSIFYLVLNLVTTYISLLVDGITRKLHSTLE